MRSGHSSRGKRQPATKHSEHGYRLNDPAEKLLGALGRKCKQCNETDVRLLDVDHIVPIGRQPARRVWGKAGTWRNVQLGIESLSNLQILCVRCHRLKTWEEREARRRATPAPSA